LEIHRIFFRGLEPEHRARAIGSPQASASRIEGPQAEARGRRGHLEPRLAALQLARQARSVSRLSSSVMATSIARYGGDSNAGSRTPARIMSWEYRLSSAFVAKAAPPMINALRR